MLLLKLVQLIAVVAACSAFVAPGSNVLGKHRSSSAISMMADRMPMSDGSNVAIITPMKPNGDIDEGAFREILRWHVECETDGIVALGTTGEASTLNMDERAQVLKIVVEEVKGKIPIIAGTGTIKTSGCIEMAQQAKDMGADATLVVTPYYVKPPQRALITHFTAIANAVDLPIMLYNVPGRTGCDMKPETVAELAKVKNIVAVKEATGDNSRVATLRELCGPDFKLYSGEDAAGKDFVLSGGNGVVSVTSNVAPAEMHQMMMAALKGDAAKATEIDDALQMLHKRLFLEANPIPVKWALHRMGRADVGVRPPLCPLDPALDAPLCEALQAAGIPTV
mmetsp:Transcript_49943/g.85860  ORF Transcript_49943/g.85860 Transcript_49943/m.85860 type:complete len:338 (+) Transcript_49943:63-1076(+)